MSLSFLDNKEQTLDFSTMAESLVSAHLLEVGQSSVHHQQHSSSCCYYDASTLQQHDGSSKTKNRTQVREELASVWQQRRQQRLRQQPFMDRPAPSQTRTTAIGSPNKKELDVQVVKRNNHRSSLVPTNKPRNGSSTQNGKNAPLISGPGCFFPPLEALLRWHDPHHTTQQQQQTKYIPQMKQPLRHSMNQTSSSVAGLIRSTGSQHQEVSNESLPESSARQQLQQRGFPSLLAIHQAHALSKQVELILKGNAESLRKEQRNNNRNAALDHGVDEQRQDVDNFQSDSDDEDEVGGEYDIDTSTSSSSLLLSVLPSGYDLQRAVYAMAKSRSRAFWLMDLAAIIYRLVEWNRQYGTKPYSSPKHVPPQPKVGFMFRASANTDSILLQVLRRALQDEAQGQQQIRLVTSTAWDYDRCLESFPSKSSNKTSLRDVLLDDSSTTGKSDGYIRKALLGKGTNGDRGGISCITVNGPNEVNRIWDTLERVQARRARQKQPSRSASNDIVNVCLRFPQNDDSTTMCSSSDSWSELWQETEKALQLRSPQSRIVAISMDISSLVDGSNDTSNLDSLCRFLCTHRDEDDNKNASPIRLELTGQARLEDEESMAFLPRLFEKSAIASVVGEVLLDMTASLLSSAGALCTRVIGVKEGALEEGNGTKAGARRRHYYIDDGCYGSLYQQQSDENAPSSSTAALNPVPLQTQLSAELNSPEEQFVSTIWGPTCDGLDRVAANILLPELQRDDWLVFPNQSSCGEGQGTAFNGFCPPDTAYCVLGYFGK
mmetsp:Transcript_20014/g.41818  ORF Transcript_20014/g.41818 Transcript_20014/m.41818 type:complete len:775 (-) Transcript_20014:974-3298(-)